MSDALTDYLIPVSGYVWQVFFFAVKHSEYQFIKDKLLNNYINTMDSLYLISKETAPGKHGHSDGEHIHIAVQMSDTDYTNFSQVIIRKYGLKGRATGGASARQYGKVNGIREIDTMLAYIMKDGDFETNMNDDFVEQLRARSYQKEATLVNKAKDIRKSSISWSERVVSELKERRDRRTEDPTWDHYKDKEIIVSCMLLNLGKNAKKFNKGTFRDMYWGIYNALPKTYENHRRIEESLIEFLDDHI